jgi:uncharacterized protein (DUF1501 family)
MPDSNAYTRREFLSTSLIMVSTAVTIPTFLQRSAWALADPLDSPLVKSRPGVPEDRILVVIQLSGGNDGLNTVVPFGYDEYYQYRPVIAVPRKDVLVVDKLNSIGLNPELAEYKALIDDGAAGIVQGVGYPNPNRSHFASMDIWHSADPTGGHGQGWLGKALDQVAVDKTGRAEPTACVCVGHEAPLAGQGQLVHPVAFENANSFRWVGSDLHEGLEPSYDTINRAGVLREIPNDRSEAAFVMRTALDAQLASDRIRKAVAAGSLTTFPNGQLANQLKMVAAMIRSGLPTRVYYVGLGGFDTHAGQPGRQPQLLRQLGQAMQAFHKELKALGQEGRVLTMAFSEFGRRVSQNASNGTDHGTAGPVFLMGDMVQQGLIGSHPSLEKSHLDQGDLVFNTDFRCVYAAILEQWLKADSTKVLGRKFAPASVLKAAVAGR